MLAELAYASEIALTESTIKEAKDLVNNVESAAQSIGLFWNAAKPKITTSLMQLQKAVYMLFMRLRD